MSYEEEDTCHMRRRMHVMLHPSIHACMCVRVCMCVCVCTRRHAGQGAMLLLFGTWSSSEESRLYYCISFLRREGI